MVALVWPKRKWKFVSWHRAAMSCYKIIWFIYGWKRRHRQIERWWRRRRRSRRKSEKRNGTRANNGQQKNDREIQYIVEQYTLLFSSRLSFPLNSKSMVNFVMCLRHVPGVYWMLLPSTTTSPPTLHRRFIFGPSFSSCYLVNGQKYVSL